MDASSIELPLAGYFPKNVIPPPGWLTGREERGIEFVSSVSECVSTGPDDWVDLWIHNWLRLFNQPDQARLVIPREGPPMPVFGYRVSTIRFVAR